MLKAQITTSLATVLAAAAIAYTPTAKADMPAYYVGGSIGGTSAPGAADSLNGKTEFEAGTRLSLALGYNINNSMRVELEASRAKSAIDTIALPGVNGGNPQNGGGSITSTAVMASGYYDFDADLPFTPYVGVGIGHAKISVNDSSAPGLSGTNDSDHALAWQIKAGAAYALSDRTDLIAGYRFFDTKDLSFVSKGGTAYTSDGARTHTFEVGLRYQF